MNQKRLNFVAYIVESFQVLRTKYALNVLLEIIHSLFFVIICTLIVWRCLAHIRLVFQKAEVMLFRHRLPPYAMYSMLFLFFWDVPSSHWYLQLYGNFSLFLRPYCFIYLFIILPHDLIALLLSPGTSGA